MRPEREARFRGLVLGGAGPLALRLSVRKDTPSGAEVLTATLNPSAARAGQWKA
jgi:hypothetical protein